MNGVIKVSKSSIAAVNNSPIHQHQMHQPRSCRMRQNDIGRERRAIARGPTGAPCIYTYKTVRPSPKQYMYTFHPDLRLPYHAMKVNWKTSSHGARRQAGQTRKNELSKLSRQKIEYLTYILYLCTVCGILSFFYHSAPVPKPSVYTNGLSHWQEGGHFGWWMV